MTIDELIEEGQRLKKGVGRKASSDFITDVSAWETQCTFMLDSVKASREVRNRLMIAFANFKLYSYKDALKIDEIIGILKGIPSDRSAKTMVKKTKKKDSEHMEPVTNCDQSKELVANNDQIDDMVEITYADDIDITKLIVVVRGQQVLIDRDIALLYKVETKVLNQKVKRNVARFPERFRFQLTKQEMKELVTNCDRFESLKHSSSAPYAFTEQGISMLSAVVTSQKAVDTSIRIMDAFVGMRRFMAANAHIFQRLDRVERQQIESKLWMEQTDDKINTILSMMDEQSPKLLPEQIFATGCVWDAWAYVSDLVRSAKQQIVLIDNFVDDRVLSLLDKRADNVEATIHSRYYEPFQTDLKKHNEQYREIKFIQLPQKNHDRFLMIDDDVYLLGASVKDMGVGMCAVTKMEVSPEMVLGLLK